MATLAPVIKWCTRPCDTSKCMVLHQDQLPTLPMERERAFNYSIAFANTRRLRLWPLKPMQSYHLFVLTYPLHIILCPFFRDKDMFCSFGLSQNHIIVLWFCLVYTPGLNRVVFIVLVPLVKPHASYFKNCEVSSSLDYVFVYITLENHQAMWPL